MVQKIINDNRGFRFQGASGSPKIHQLKIYKAGPSASSEFIRFNTGSYSSPEITENEIWTVNPTGKSCVGIFVEVNTSSFSGQLKIEKNNIYDVSNCFQTNNGGGG